MDINEIIPKLQELEGLGGQAELQALTLIVDERIRQMVEEGWTPQLDDANRCTGQLASAGACYALAESQSVIRHSATGATEVRPSSPHPSWPFSRVAWRPASMRRMLVKALALLVAELTRLLRAGIE
jgi:bacterioferritin-associated ferredoxin